MSSLSLTQTSGVFLLGLSFPPSTPYSSLPRSAFTLSLCVLSSIPTPRPLCLSLHSPGIRHALSSGSHDTILSRNSSFLPLHQLLSLCFPNVGASSPVLHSSWGSIPSCSSHLSPVLSLTLPHLLGDSSSSPRLHLNRFPTQARCQDTHPFTPEAWHFRAHPIHPLVQLAPSLELPHRCYSSGPTLLTPAPHCRVLPVDLAVPGGTPTGQCVLCTLTCLCPQAPLPDLPSGWGPLTRSLPDHVCYPWVTHPSHVDL